MATVTIGNRSRNRLSPEAIAERKRAAATAELEKNGIKVPATPKPATVVDPLVQRARVEQLAKRQLAVDLPGIAITARATTGRDDFRSGPGARAMTQRDISNIQMLTRDDAKELLDAIEAVAPEIVAKVKRQIDRDWDTMLDAGERFTLSALGARKAAREQGVKLKAK